MLAQPMYRAHIIEYPAFEDYIAWDERGGSFEESEWTRPVGWEADPDYVERFKTNKFFEPNTDKWFKSRSSAKSRVDLLNAMGYVAIVQQSAPVEWPADGQEKVTSSDWDRVKRAVRELVDLGVIRSADEII